MQIGLPTAVFVAVALALTGTAAPASAAKVPPPCMTTDIKLVTASFKVKAADRAVKKASTPRMRAAAKKKLRAAKKRQTALKRKLASCVETNLLQVSKTTIGATEGFTVTVGAPEPPSGKHYRVVVYAGIPAEGDPGYFSCTLAGRYDWVSPTDYVSAVPTSEPGWCAGQGSVSLQLVPDDAPIQYQGSTIARKPIHFTP